MSDYLLYYHNIVFLFVVFTLAPLPLALLELCFPSALGRYKLQPKVQLPPTSFFQCYKDVMRIFILIVGPLQLFSYPSVKLEGICRRLLSPRRQNGDGRSYGIVPQAEPGDLRSPSARGVHGVAAVWRRQDLAPQRSRPRGVTRF